MVQQFINKQFFYLFIFTLFFGLTLYGTIGFDGIDEICAFFLLLLLGYGTIKSPNWAVNKTFLAVIGIFLFYLTYSFAIHSNTTMGIIKDFIIQFKPYLAFFGVYYLAPVLDKSQKKILSDCCLVLWGIMFALGIGSLYDDLFLFRTTGHVAYYAAIVTSISMLYLYCNDDNAKSKLIFILMLATGLFSGRSKFYGFLLLAIIITVFYSDVKRFKINARTFVLVVFTLISLILVSWQKLVMYFGLGESIDSVPEGYLARVMLYITSIDVLQDYTPFGPGFASFASFASGEYYSPLYAKYGLDQIAGITKDDYSYIADTYFPCLCQFGYVGLFLFFWFFFYLVRKSYLFLQKEQSGKYFIITLLIIGYFLIESVADATYTSHRGFFMMMLLGLVLSEQKRKMNAKINGEES